jgi:glycosyltransferase involved in cell wall biosynthesis
MVRISVCMATYNGEKYIFQQLESILKQIGDHDEVIISDDSSSDGTLAIISSFNDIRIKVFKEQKFKDPIFNFEHALQRACGEVIFLADQDDIWHDDKVSIVMDKLQHFDMAVTDCSFIDEEGKILVESYFDLANSAPGVIKNLQKNSYFGCCMAFKKSILKKALPFPKDIPMHDIWLGFVSDIFYKSVFIPEKLTFYRKHNSNASIASSVVSNIGILTKLKFRINIVKYLPTLILR